MKSCDVCGVEIPAARLAALSGVTTCVEHSEETPVRGLMIYDHKTAPSIVIGEDAEKLLPYQRRGFHAQLPFNGKNNPRMVASQANNNLSAEVKLAPPEHEAFESIGKTLVPARCHPERPRINSQGHCLECALKLQKARLR